MAEYTIINAGANKRLNLWGDNVTSTTIYNHQNVTMWSTSGTIEQRWLVDSLGNGVTIRAKVNPDYGLNVYRAGNPWNCDVYVISGNETDATVNIIQVGGRYRIQLANYPHLYLTAGGNTDGANVYWNELIDGSAYQTWYFYDVTTNTDYPPEEPPITNNPLSMPCNINQKYNGYNALIQAAGCCVCCCCDVASYYRGTPYTLEDLKAAGVYSDTSVNAIWGRVPSANLHYCYKNNENEYRQTICSEIDSGRPVLVGMTGGGEHWVVAYGYVNNGSSNADILVLDPYNPDSTSPTGQYITLAQSFAQQGRTSILHLMTTSAK